MAKPSYGFVRWYIFTENKLVPGEWHRNESMCLVWIGGRDYYYHLN